MPKSISKRNFGAEKSAPNLTGAMARCDAFAIFQRHFQAQPTLSAGGGCSYESIISGPAQLSDFSFMNTEVLAFLLGFVCSFLLLNAVVLVLS